jgi:membrane protein implicated in regulation of membrane protease activity
MGLAVVLSLLATWIGLVTAYDTGWPVGFLISAVVTVIYLGARALGPRLEGQRRTVQAMEHGKDEVILKSRMAEGS